MSGKGAGVEEKQEQCETSGKSNGREWTRGLFGPRGVPTGRMAASAIIIPSDSTKKIPADMERCM